MRHVKTITRPPLPASTDIDLNGTFDTKVEAKESTINDKATALS